MRRSKKKTAFTTSDDTENESSHTEGVMRRRRKSGHRLSSVSFLESDENTAVSDVDKEPAVSESESRALLSPTKAPESKWQNFWIRSFWTAFMIISFVLIILAGHIWVVMMVRHI